MSAVDALYASIEAEDDSLTDEQVLHARMLIGEAEGILVRYFGM